MLIGLGQVPLNLIVIGYAMLSKHYAFGNIVMAA